MINLLEEMILAQLEQFEQSDHDGPDLIIIVTEATAKKPRKPKKKGSTRRPLMLTDTPAPR